MKRPIILTAMAAVTVFSAFAQRKTVIPPGTDTSKPKPPVVAPPKQGPKAYKDVITDKAVTTTGLFTVHKVEEKWYFEIPDSLLKKQVMAITRFSKTAGGGVYGGEMANQQVLQWEKGPNNTLFLRVVILVNMADSTNKIYKAVTNSNVNPIAASFDIKAFGKDTTSTIIDVTDFFKGDNLVVSIPQSVKGRMKLGGLAGDRSYIDHISTFPINTEVRTVKTFMVGGGPSNPLGFSFNSPTDAAGASTLELNTSFILLPSTPMKKRLFDRRVGYFADDYTVYTDDQQKVENQEFIVRWRLEPKPEDMEKWQRGELVEPKKPIIYYIDPATPRKWVSYLIAGVNDWQKAFEKAGFRHAIEAREWPEHDSTMSLEDARYSVLRYFASDIENAYGPNVHDPRSGEIIESHIGWYHNIMELLHDWYMIQTAAVDPRARKVRLDDSLMGQLIRFVSSHEVGHTLGLRHNMGSSSTVPVEKLRDKAWLDEHGHTPSIMDYARFNYVAQPQDNIPEADLFPRIGEYDRWAIKWGYSWSGAKDEKEDEKIVNKWIIDSLRSNPRLWFGGEGYSLDSRAQTEDLGDNNMKAGEYGIKNLQRILPNLPEWTREEADKYENLSDMYRQVVGQFNRYVGHVLRNVGGVYENFHSVEEPGDVYAPAPKARQQEAVAFLNKQVFQTPQWLLDKGILNKISNPAGGDPVGSMQTSVLGSLLSNSRLNNLLLAAGRFGDAKVYTVDELLADVRKEIWKELSTHGAIDPYRRNLQKAYVEALIALANPAPPQSMNIAPGFTLTFGVNTKNTDLTSIGKGELEELRARLLNAIPATTDKISRYHLKDLAERIKLALNPKG
ncbi:zinc-dependent metalloprotease [Flavitalea sp. BT771]|uniref:zinc-dependent metalloprotease n=1 Tax=Flavitalea sp. BT771 TaxID=3063329 RepID=UPI0026E2A1ED|nr:zinc-dependent metalloprotease [Flavitalea sp. BT771]MDO6430591.1 zinc-dependent metalloprotease [Flavitalea sp. BT771]MDV6219269.1 zinc-dependent metalloprotease [Flavitalea sp. BT771]